MNGIAALLLKINQVQEFATQSMYKYNYQRPNMALEALQQNSSGYGCLMNTTCWARLNKGGLTGVTAQLTTIRNKYMI